MPRATIKNFATNYIAENNIHLSFQSLETRSPKSVHWAESKVSAGLPSLWRLQERSYLPIPASGGYQHSLCICHITPVFKATILKSLSDPPSHCLLACVYSNLKIFNLITPVIWGNIPKFQGLRGEYFRGEEVCFSAYHNQ